MDIVIPKNKAWIGFSTRDNWKSKSILWFRKKVNGRKAWCSHTFPIVVMDGKLWAIDADSDGIELNRLTGKEGYDKTGMRVKIYEYDALPNVKEIAEKMIEEDVGGTYGYGQLIGMAWVSLWAWAGYKFNNPIKWRLICSEISARFVSSTCVQESLKIQVSLFGFDRIAPDDLEIIMKDFGCRLVTEKKPEDETLKFLAVS